MKSLFSVFDIVSTFWPIHSMAFLFYCTDLKNGVYVFVWQKFYFYTCILSLVWFICLMAYQLLMGYLMPKLDSLVNGWFQIFLSDINDFYQISIICFHIVKQFQVFLSNRNNFHTAI